MGTLSYMSPESLSAAENDEEEGESKFKVRMGLGNCGTSCECSRIEQAHLELLKKIGLQGFCVEVNLKFICEARGFDIL